MENAAYTFEQLLYKAKQENPESSGSAMEKARLRVLKVRGPSPERKGCLVTVSTHAY